MSIKYHLIYNENINHFKNNDFDKDTKVIIFNNYPSKNIDYNYGNIKKKFLNYLYSFKQSHPSIEKIIDILSKEKSNLWNMSTLNEKSPYKLSNFDEIIKIFSIVEDIKKNNNYNIYYHGMPEYLEKIFCNLLHNTNNNKFKKFSQSFLIKKNIKNILRIISNLFKTFIFLILYIKNNNILFHKKRKFNLSNNNVILISYFTHLKRSINTNNTFYSNQWGELEKKLNQINIDVDYLHLYENSSSPLNKKQLIRFVHKNNNKHHFFQNFLSYGDLINIFYNYFRIYIIFIFNYFFYFFSQIYNTNPLFCLFEKEFINTLTGIPLLENLIYDRIFYNFFEIQNKKIPIIYLMENQPWENPLLFYAKNKSNFKIIGYPHTTINPWHFNYIYNKKFNQIPNLIFSSGKINYDKLFIQKDLKKIIKEVESLRYSQKINPKNNSKKNSILVLGDYIDNNNKLFLSTEFIKTFKMNNYKFDFKPHPSKIKIYNKINTIKITNEELNNIINNYEIFICCNSTASSAELYHNNKIVIIYIPNNKINLSPFLQNIKIPNLFFFSKIDELIEILNKLKISKSFLKNNKLFEINTNISKWIEQIEKII